MKRSSVRPRCHPWLSIDVVKIIVAIRAIVLFSFLSSSVLADSETEKQRRQRELAGPYYNLEYRLIGPAAGGRVSRVAGMPGDALTYWTASSAGGVWKSTNGGVEWKSVFDEQPVSSIGSIAISRSDPNVIWVGSGEANIRGNVGEGNGIYRSTDGGDTWSHVWTAEGQIGTIIADPQNSEVAYAAVLGSPFGPGEDRGVLRTTDGGRSWSKVLFVDADTGASDICFDPNNSRILFAGTWQTRRTPWSLTSGGPGSGLWTSRDAGNTWTRLKGNGLPDGIWGKVGVGVAASDSRRVYALIEAKAGGLFRSDDGGESWKLVNPSRGLRQRAWYYTTFTIDPTNADIVWFPQVRLLKTVDGGRTVRTVEGEGWDYHDIWIDPANPSRIINGSDAGVSVSTDGGKSWLRSPLPIAQFYHVNVDTQVPYRILGTLQDFGTVSGPSNSLTAAGILLSDWHSVGGGEAGHVVADPTDPKVVWAGEYLGFISRWDGRTRRGPHLGIYPDNGSGHGGRDLKFRFQWTAPILISPHDHNTVYHAGNLIFRTNDAGQHWEPISPDLSRNDRSKQEPSGGPLTGDNTGVEYYGTVFALDESPLKRGLLWAGTDDGLVHVSRDGGVNWQSVTPPDMPAWATVSCIQASRHDEATAYLVADAHRMDDEAPYLWKTSNFGRSWSRLQGTTSAGPLDRETYLHVVREDPLVNGLLYLGTERGVLVSHDDGASWLSLRLNMPTVSVVDLVVAGDDLVVATLGRSAWILDDLGPIRTMKQGSRPDAPYLFPPLESIRWFYGSDWDSGPGSRAGAGDNPPAGSILTYFLPRKPQAAITLEILDAENKTLRRLSSELQVQYTSEDHPEWNPDTELEPDLPTKVGLNRASWDLAYERPHWVKGTRNDVGEPKAGPRVVPGTYKVLLSVDGHVSTQMLRIKPDPRSSVTAADSQLQVEFCKSLRDRLSEIARTVDRIRAVQNDITNIHKRLSDAPTAKELKDHCRTSSDQLTAIENRLHNPKAEIDYDVLTGREGGAKLYSRLAWLAAGASEHDGPPTQGMLEVAADIQREFEAARADLDRLLSSTVAELNSALSKFAVPHIDPSSR